MHKGSSFKKPVYKEDGEGAVSKSVEQNTQM